MITKLTVEKFGKNFEDRNNLPAILKKFFAALLDFCLLGKCEMKKIRGTKMTENFP